MRGEFYALAYIAPRGGHDFIEEAAGLTGIAGHIGHALLVAVELFKRSDRQEHIVFLEPEQAARIVHQHIGVDHEELLQRLGSGTFS